MRRWPLLPKLHFFHHAMRDLVISSKELEWTLSPLVYSVQMQEDFIGKPSRVSRRVSPKMHSQRTLQRVLLAQFAEFDRAEK